jgi:hypothetical protein
VTGDYDRRWAHSLWKAENDDVIVESTNQKRAQYNVMQHASGSMTWCWGSFLSVCVFDIMQGITAQAGVLCGSQTAEAWGYWVCATNLKLIGHMLAAGGARLEFGGTARFFSNQWDGRVCAVVQCTRGSA